MIRIAVSFGVVSRRRRSFGKIGVRSSKAFLPVSYTHLDVYKRQGKGIASSVGIIFTFDWRMVPICAILFFASVVPTGFMSLGSLGILSGFFVQTIVFGQMGWLKIATQFLPEVYVLTGILTALAFWQHRTNIKRLATGTENKFRPAKK